MNSRDIKEKIVTGLFFTGIFLPVRLVFYHYVTTWWLGSFGLMTGILVTLMYLSKKKKLGRLGRIVERQVTKISKGKLGKFAMFQMLFFIYVMSNMIYGIEYADPQVRQRYVDTFADMGVTDLDSMAEKSPNLRWDGPMAGLGILFSLLVVFTPNSVGHAFFSILNDWSDGWILHFVTVALVQDLEVFALMVYFRWFRKDHSPLNNSET